MANRLREIQALGQAIWIDNLHRGLLDDGTLRRLIEEDAISGVTSNPTIFKKGVGDSDRYDDVIRKIAADTEHPQQLFERLAYRDIRDAADLLRPTYERTGGQDGFVSFELPASLAYDATGSVEAAEHHRARIDRPNVFIKVPGTEEGVRAFEELTARGLNVNVTLLFAVERYREIAEAYLRGLERRLDAGEPITRSASVASFFVSRVDTKVDKALGGRGLPASALGIDVDKEPRLSGHALRRRADRAGDGQHDAGRHDRGRPRPRDSGAHGGSGLRGRPCGDGVAPRRGRRPGRHRDAPARDRGGGHVRRVLRR